MVTSFPQRQTFPIHGSESAAHFFLTCEFVCCIILVKSAFVSRPETSVCEDRLRCPLAGFFFCAIMPVSTGLLIANSELRCSGTEVPRYRYTLSAYYSFYFPKSKIFNFWEIESKSNSLEMDVLIVEHCKIGIALRAAHGAALH